MVAPRELHVYHFLKLDKASYSKKIETIVTFSGGKMHFKQIYLIKPKFKNVYLFRYLKEMLGPVPRL